MIKTNKLVALGILAAVGANFIVAPAVSAASTGATTFTYTVGEVPGGGDGSGDGSTATWKVSYPVQTSLTDGNISKKGAELGFKVSAIGSGNLTEILKGKNITIKPSSPTIALTKTGGNGGNSVTVQLAKGNSAAEAVDLKASEAIVTLNGTATTGKGYAYIQSKDSVKQGDSYSGTVTWDIAEGNA